MKWMYKLTEHKTILSLIFVFVFGLLMIPTVKAASDSGYGYDSDDPFGVKVLEGENDDNAKIALGDQDLRVTVTNIINVALSLLGIVAVVVILVGGFKWMTAGGNDDQVGEAKKWIFSGIIGLAIILSAWAIARFALSSLGEATSTIDEGTY